MTGDRFGRITRQRLAHLEVRHPGAEPAGEAELCRDFHCSARMLRGDAGLTRHLEHLGRKGVGVGTREVGGGSGHRVRGGDCVGDGRPRRLEATEQPLHHCQVGSRSDTGVMREQRLGRGP